MVSPRIVLRGQAAARVVALCVVLAAAIAPPAPADNPGPTGTLTATPSLGTEPLPVQLDASSFVDPDGIASYYFATGDGRAVTQKSPTLAHTYAAGEWTASVTVTDGLGAITTSTCNVSVSPPAELARAVDAVERLALAWRSRDAAGCGDLLTEDFRFTFAPWDSAGDPFPGRSWDRATELAVVDRMFAGVYPQIQLALEEPSTLGTSYELGHTYPSHVQVLVPRLALEVDHDGTRKTEVRGRALFSLVRGDSARVPPGAVADPTRWYVESWQDWTGIGPSDNALPTASLLNPPGTSAQLKTLDASRSFDPDGIIVRYRFDFGDGTSQTQFSPIVTHLYPYGRWTARVTVVDDRGWEGSASREIVAGLDRPPVVTAPLSVEVGVGRALAFSFGASDPDGQAITELTAQIPNGATFTTSADRSQGSFQWTPPDTGRFTLRFTAANTLVTTVETRLWVFPDRPPYVGAPAGVTIRLGETFSFGVVAGDVDGDPVTSLTAAGPPGSAFTPAANNTAGTFTWTPSDTGRSTVTFTASNALSGSRSTSLKVLPTNQPPIAALTATPNGGIEPQVVTLDASGSRDPDGAIQSYLFEFGDGTMYDTVSPRITHTYMAGRWNLKVTVTDSDRAKTSATFVLDVFLPSTLPNLARNPSFEEDLRYWNSYAGGVLERIEGEAHAGNVGLKVTGPAVMNGSFGANDSPDQVRWTLAPGLRYRYTAWVRSASSRGTARIKIREYLISTGAKLGEAQSAGVILSPEWQMLSLDYVTTAANSTLDFQVRDWPVAPGEVFFTDDIAIHHVSATPGAETGMASWYKGEDPIPMQARLVPSPIRHAGTLSFMTSESGPLRVEILDLAGRRMRRLVDERDAPAGMYELAIGRDGDGPRLQAGVYFYRIEAREGARSGRFVILP